MAPDSPASPPPQIIQHAKSHGTIPKDNQSIAVLVHGVVAKHPVP